MMAIVLEYRVTNSAPGFVWRTSNLQQYFKFDPQSRRHSARQIFDHLVSRKARSVAYIAHSYDYRIRETITDVTFYYVSAEQLKELIVLHEASQKKKKIEIGI
jgi:hypothetical protein